MTFSGEGVTLRALEAEVSTGQDKESRWNQASTLAWEPRDLEFASNSVTFWQCSLSKVPSSVWVSVSPSLNICK